MSAGQAACTAAVMNRISAGEELMGRARLGVGEGVDVATDAGEDHVGADGTPLHLDGRAGHADPHVTVTWSRHAAQCRALV